MVDTQQTKKVSARERARAAGAARAERLREEEKRVESALQEWFQSADAVDAANDALQAAQRKSRDALAGLVEVGLKQGEIAEHTGLTVTEVRRLQREARAEQTEETGS